MKEKFRMCIALICISIALYGCTQEDDRDYNAEFNEYVSVYKEKYNIDLKLVQGEIEYFDLEVEECEINEEVIDSLAVMEETLDKFPENFIKNLKIEIGHVVIKVGIELYVGGKIDNGDGISSGTTSYLNPEKYTIVVNVKSNNNRGKTIAHEIFHVMYNIVLEKENIGWAKSIAEEKWNSYNPEGFVYGSEGGKKYTVSDCDLNEVHFVTDYSRISMSEDMAEIFGYLMTDVNNKTFKSDHVKAKAKLISNMIRENFDNIGEEPYWDKLIKDVVLEGEYGLKIGEKKENDNICWEIMVWNDGIDFKQSITLNKDESVLEFPAREDMVLQKDVNFDGYNDILICLGTYKNDIVRYEAYIWDKTTNNLIYNESFKAIPNPQFNEKRQEIRGGLIGEDGVYTVFSYEYNNGKFVENTKMY